MSPIIPYTPGQQIARQIKRKRKILRLSQTELAARAKTSQPVIARLEANQGNPTLDLIQRVVTALDLKLILSFEPQPPREPEPEWLSQP